MRAQCLSSRNFPDPLDNATAYQATGIKISFKKRSASAGLFFSADLFLHACVIGAAVYTKYYGRPKPSPEEKSLAVIGIIYKTLALGVFLI